MDTTYDLVRKQERRTQRWVSGVHMRENDGSFRALCTIDVTNVGNPREAWVDVPVTEGVTCRGCRAVYMARRLRDYVTGSNLKTTVLMDFATWFEKNARGEHA